jgi:pyridoxine kinase
VTTILSIQSSVAYGHVGNSAVTFPLMRMGVEVWPLNTVHFSNHTGYETSRGPLLGAADLRNVLQGIDERGVLGQVDAVLSGYQGGADIGTMILEAVALVKVRNPAAIYCCDPVLGDADVGSYVLPGIAEFMREQVVPAAQIITPNQFELTCLTGLPVATMDDVLGAADAARGLGPDIVLVTSVVRLDARPGTIEMVAVDGDRGMVGLDTATGAYVHRQRRCHGRHLPGGPAAAAGSPNGPLRTTAAVIYGLLAATDTLGRSELALIAAQDEFIRPSHSFEAAASPLVAEDLDVGAQGIQSVSQILIAAVDHIDIPQLGLTTGGEHPEQDADRGPQRGRTDHLLASPAGGSFHNDAMRIQQLHARTQPVQLSQIDRAVLIHPVMMIVLPCAVAAITAKNGRLSMFSPGKGIG